MSEQSEPLAILRSGPVGVSSPTEMESALQAHLPWLEEQIAQLPLQHRRHKQARKQQRFLMAGGACAAAAVVLFAFVLLSSENAGSVASTTDSKAHSLEQEPFATLVSGRVKSDTMEVLTGSRLSLTSRVATGSEEGAALVAAGAYQLELGRNSDVSLTPPHKHQVGSETLVRLHHGRAQLSVAPLPTGSTFSVVAPDLTVTVVGTSFSVETREGAPTCVQVTEGRVLVDRKGASQVLSAGQKWGCDEGEAAPVPQIRAEESLEKNTKRSRGTTLAEENALLSAALSAERQGDPDRAQRAFRKLLKRYPQSVFAQDARAGLARLDRGQEGE